MNIPLKNTFLRIKLHWVPGNATFFKSRNSNNLVNFKVGNGSMQLEKVYLGAMIVSQFPLGITAAVPGCRCHHCPCVAGASSSVPGLHFIANCDLCSSLSSLKAKC